MMLSDPIIVVDVVTEPVTLDDAKRHMNMLFETSGSYTFTDDDAYIESLIPVAREAIERFTGKSLAPKTISVTSEGVQLLPYGPVNSIVSVNDVDGVVDAEDYTIQFGSIVSPTCRYLTTVYTAGYTVLPTGLKHAILEEVSWRYHHRGEESEISKPARDLAKKYRVVTWLA